MNRRPTFAELRGKVFKHSRITSESLDARRPAAEIGNWPARRVGRPAALPGTWCAIRLGLSAHFITLCALIAALGGAGSIATGNDLGFVLGVGLLLLSYWLDHVDGQVARWNDSASLNGVYFDYMLHHVGALAVGFGLGERLAMRSNDPRWSFAGFAIALGWISLSLHNDCRYKAFFQRLKRESHAFRIASRPLERPAPPPSRPRSGIGAFAWPAFKSCEPHIVLITLTIAAILLMIIPELARVLIRLYVFAMAIVAPALALARSSRAILRGSIETDFAGWFETKDSREA